MPEALQRDPIADNSKFVALIRANATITTIMRVTGLAEPTIRRRIRTLNLTYAPETSKRGTFNTRFDEAAASATFRFRFNVLQWLSAYQEHFEPALNNSELSRATGLTTREIARFSERPYDHDWRLTQLARLARALGMTFLNLMTDCSTKNRLLPPELDEGVLHPDQLDTDG